jgi:hypothetical protein
MRGFVSAKTAGHIPDNPLILKQQNFDHAGHACIVFAAKTEIVVAPQRPPSGMKLSGFINKVVPQSEPAENTTEPARQ